jgi:protein-S-isoprenylcysteine O-methyltransferase Ste14
MHYLAGALLILQFGMIWLLDKKISIQGLDILALGLWGIGMVLLFLPIISLRRKGDVPEKRSYIETEVLVDSGIYAVVRHPQYLGWILMYPVVFLLNPRLEIAAVGIAGMVCMLLVTKQEEELLIEKFGEQYILYMQSVPRLNPFLGILRMIRRL